jgi:hypothetical protein
LSRRAPMPARRVEPDHEEASNDSRRILRIAPKAEDARVMNTAHDSQSNTHDLLARMQGKAIERFELELSDLRTTMLAMANCCEQSLTRLRDARWVSFEAASRLVTELSDAADAERSRAARLSEDLEAAKHAVEEVRAECRAEVEIARDAAVKYRDETYASCMRELNAARQLAVSAMDAEARVREELTAMQARNQEIVDGQMLRLVELKRELELASADADRARVAAETANRESVAKLSQRPAALTPTPAPTPAPEPAREVVALHRNDVAQPHRNDLTPEFSDIEAVLAGSPPVPAWERIA